jgi:predicted metalloprotease
LGGDPSSILSSGAGSGSPRTEQRELTAEDKKIGEMVDMMGKWNITTWDQVFRKTECSILHRKLSFFRKPHNPAAEWHSLQWDLLLSCRSVCLYGHELFNELQQRFGAKVTEFTVAYVLAHEVGHHVQTLLGTTQKVDQLRRSGKYSEAEMNRVSVATELQADFYAGVWAKERMLKSTFLNPEIFSRLLKQLKR